MRFAAPAGISQNRFYAVGADDSSNESTADSALGVELLPFSADRRLDSRAIRDLTPCGSKLLLRCPATNTRL